MKDPRSVAHRLLNKVIGDTGDRRSAFLTGSEAEDQMTGIYAVTGGEEVSCDFGGREGLDCEVGDDGGDGLALAARVLMDG
jgi:hypothetical protein